MIRILIVEDERIIRKALKKLLETKSYAVSEAGSVQEAVSNYNLQEFNLIISDLRLPGTSGTDLISISGKTPVLIMTSYASLKSAVDSMKIGAVDYIAKPFDHEHMLSTVTQIIHDNPINEEPGFEDDNPSELPRLIGQCQAMKKVYHYVKKSAPTDCNILIHGETGTGKELIARAIHQYSNRAQRPILCVNCAAIPETLIESELFGYEKGAFTGANTLRIGLIEAADKGTLFLDEIGELPLEAQARLLRFLQEGEIRRIGSVAPQKVDVRVICATHKNLKKAYQQGDFRQDLYYRLNVMQIDLPPLRERGKDIIEIATTALSRNCQKMQKPEAEFSAKAIQALTSYQWPGNVRELENVIERAVILSDSSLITNDLLNIELELVNVDQFDEQQDIPTVKNTLDNDEEGLSLEDYFQKFILENQEHMSETALAQKLGVSRKCLWERRQRLGIPRKKTKTSKTKAEV